MSGFLAACAYCGFPLLGFMPSVGNIPKLLVAFFAAAAFIFVGRRRWIFAGAAGGLAFLDWQIGILVVFAVLAGAFFEGERRIRSSGWAAIGAVCGIAPFILYFFMNDALGNAIYQTVVCARARGGSASLDFHENALHIWRVVQRGCAGQEWLVLFAMLGAVLFPFWARGHLRKKARSQVVALGVFHYGIVSYSLFDFQLFGDLFILLHSVAFFLGIAFIEILRFFRDAFSRCWASRSWPARYSGLSSLLMCAVVMLVTRPSILRSEFSPTSKNDRPIPTLSDQQEVNRALEPIIRDKRLAFIGYVEQLILSGRKNDIPHVGWTPGDVFSERSTVEESRTDTWIRLVRKSCPEVVATAGKVREDETFMEYFERVRLVSANGSYQIEFYVLRESIPFDRYAREFCATGGDDERVDAKAIIRR
jgi:hypothetical protein